MSHAIEVVLTQEAMCQKSFKLRVASRKVFIIAAFVSAVVRFRTPCNACSGGDIC